MKHPFTEKGLHQRLIRIRKAFDEACKQVTNLHVRIQPGNSKTGWACWTVSLLPVFDCVNCELCKFFCYDLKSDLWRPQTIEDRAKNSAIHKHNPDRYWSEIDLQIKANFVTALRINVGGDLNDIDFEHVKNLGLNNPKVDFLFFTKNYKGINAFLDKTNFPKNVQSIMSVWPGMPYENPHNLPCAHVLFEDGTTTAPEYGAYYCGGNCSECHFNKEGCWVLKPGEHLILRVH